MASFRFPFKRNVRFTGAYRLPAGKNALAVLESQLFVAPTLDAEASVSLAAFSINSQAVFGNFVNPVYLGGISFGPISSAPISGVLEVGLPPPLSPEASLGWDAFTLTAEATVQGNTAAASRTWAAFTITSEVDWGRRLTFSVSLAPFTLTATFQEANNANLTATLDPFTVEASADVDTDAEVNVSLDAFTLEASLDNRIDIELSANWDPFTVFARTERRPRRGLGGIAASGRIATGSLRAGYRSTGAASGAPFGRLQ